MSSKILVDTLTQPTWWTCFHTCLVMLDRYRSARAGIFHQPSELEAMLYPDSSKFKVDSRMNAYLTGKGPAGSELNKYLVRRFKDKRPTGLLSSADAREMAKLMEFAYSNIMADPIQFDRILNVYGPFIWVGNLKHTVLVTSLEQRKTNYFVSYNDPGYGTRRESEFYQFLVDLMPSMKVLGTKMSEVFHVKK